MKRKEFIIFDSNARILPSHKCNRCEYILNEPHLCKNMCGVYCIDHLPENSKCEECDEALNKNEEMNEIIINKYKIKCTSCDEGMMLRDYKDHKKIGCKKNCPQNCDSKLLEEEMEEHIKMHCTNTITSCIGCDKKEKRGLIELHQLECRDALKHFEVIEPIKKQIFEINLIVDLQRQKIEILEQENQNFKQENQILLQRVSQLEIYSDLFKYLSEKRMEKERKKERTVILIKLWGAGKIIKNYIF